MGFQKFIGAIALLGAVMVCGPAFAACNLGLIAELPLVKSGGYSELPVKINGADARLVVDSGAFFSVITPGAADRLHMTSTAQEFDIRGVGVGGTTGRIAVRLAKDFTIAGVDLHNVDFELGEKGFGEADGLLGQNLLAFPEVEYDLGHDVMRFFKPNGCSVEPLAYWATAQPYSVIDIETRSKTELAHMTGYAFINGQKIKVAFDTGSPSSTMTLAAAERAGVKPYDPGVYRAGSTSGVARNSEVPIWNAPFASFKLGDEEIKNVRIFVGPLGIGETEDMLLGSDFFRSHRILVSYTQDKLYFTYNGGVVFDASPHPRQAVEAAGQPLDADGFSRRGLLKYLQKDFDGAIADLTQAMSLAPDNALYPYQRGNAYWAAHKLPLAMSDFDQSLKLKPDSIGVLLARSSLHLKNKELSLAKADLAAADGIAAKDPKWGLALGEAYSAQDDQEKSVHWLDAWVATMPRDARMGEALNARCWSRALLGRELTNALADCNASLALSPGDPAVLDSRGLVRLRLGDYDGSITDYNRAIAGHPNEAWSYYGRALAEENKGMAAEGEDDERKAKRLSPDIAATAARYGITRPSL